MNIYFGATYQGDKQFGQFYKLIFDEIERLGYSNLNDDAIKYTYDDYIKKMAKGRSEQVENYNRRMEYIKKADICVFEASSHSLGIGFLVQKAIAEGKPVVVLFYDKNQPFFLQGIDDEKVIIRAYKEKTIKKVLKDSLDLARERRDKRFNFFLSPKLLDYLERASKRDGVTKSKLIRDLIVENMRENTEE